MMWMDYVINSLPFGKGFKILGDWEGEVMGVDRDGTPKENFLYKPGDVFVVDEAGWLIKSDHLSTLMMKYEEGKQKNGHSTSD